jgi:acetyl esterase/lipase
MMIKALYIFAFAGFFVGLLYHFAALKAFNLFVPKDQGTERLSLGVSYGRDPQQKLDVYRTKDANILPVLIFVHGGSWKDGDRADYEFVGRAFAAQGYLTLVVDYRLLPQSIYPAFIEDVAKVIAWSNSNAKDFGGDGGKIYVVGHSAGAYNMAMAILNRHYLGDAGADPASVKALAGLSGPYDFLPLDSPLTIAAFGQVKDLPATQPIKFVRADAPPFLLLHGTADTTVYPRNSRSLAKHIQEAGGQAAVKEYEGVTHVGVMLDLAKPLRGRAPVLEDIVKFFRDNAR